MTKPRVFWNRSYAGDAFLIYWTDAFESGKDNQSVNLAVMDCTITIALLNSALESRGDRKNRKISRKQNLPKVSAYAPTFT
jgi:hypothetical protein